MCIHLSTYTKSIHIYPYLRIYIYTQNIQICVHVKGMYAHTFVCNTLLLDLATASYVPTLVPTYLPALLFRASDDNAGGNRLAEKIELMSGP